MYAANKQGGGRSAKAYAQVGLETSVMSASPYQLITLLFDAARGAVSLAKYHMAAGEIAAKGKAISRAINLIQNGLLTSLDKKAVGPAGADLVHNLESLYAYMIQNLLLANVRNDISKLDEVDRLLENVSSAWREIGPAVTE